MNAFAHPFFVFLTNALWAGVAVWFVSKFPEEVRNLLGRLRKAGPTGVEIDPLVKEAGDIEKQAQSLNAQVLSKAPPAQIADRIAQIQTSLQSASSLVGRMNVTEAPDTVSIQGGAD